MEEIFVGVEWDDIERGKNSGAVLVSERRGEEQSRKEIQFFTVNVPGAGSFLRLKALDIPTIFMRVGVLDAMKERYNREENEDAVKEFVFSSSPHSSYSISSPRRRSQPRSDVYGEKYEFVPSLTPLDEFENLVYADLSSLSISEIGEKEILSKTLPSLEVLDLSQNLLGFWSDLYSLFSLASSSPFKIVPSLPSLRTLNLRKNRLSHPEGLLELANRFSVGEKELETEGERKGLHVLVLNHTWSTWETLDFLARFCLLVLLFYCSFLFLKFNFSSGMFSSLIQLYASQNLISSIYLSPSLSLFSSPSFLSSNTSNFFSPYSRSFWRTLCLLDLSHNQLQDWEELSILGREIVLLETLYLSHNELRDIPEGWGRNIKKEGEENETEISEKKVQEVEIGIDQVKNEIFFPSLKTLTLDENLLSSLSSIHALSFLRLKKLRVSQQRGTFPGEPPVFQYSIYKSTLL